jgi:diguanylate cyclase (GGDEF)-like protein
MEVILATMSSESFPIVTAIFSDEKSRLLLMENGFSLIDLKTSKVMLSKRIAGIGIKDNNFFSSTFDGLIHGEDTNGFVSLFEKIRSGSLDQGKGQFRFITENGENLWLSIDMRIVDRDAQGNPLILAMHDQDITNLHDAQEEIRERLLEIDSLKDLLLAINKSLDFGETIERIIEHLHKVIPFDRATVLSHDGTDLAVIGNYRYTNAQTQGLRFTVKGKDNPSGRAIATKRPIICNDVINDFDGFVQVDQNAVVRSWLGIPLVYEGRAIGLLSLDCFTPGFYTERHIRLTSNMAEHISIAIEHARQHSMVKEEARTDSLTGIANRYGLETIGHEIFLRALRSDSSIGVLMIDIDFFKDVNDKRGHAYGDKVLIALANGIQRSLRAKDYLVRYGGEEFLVLLPETSTREALVVAERLREKVPKLTIEGNETCPTISIGIFSGTPDTQDMMYEFIRRADIALYDAKSAGRNRCRVWSSKNEFFETMV